MRTINYFLLLAVFSILLLTGRRAAATPADSRAVYISAELDAIRSELAAIEIQYKIPKHLLEALCTIESSLRPTAVNLNDGGLGNSSFGLCQVGYLTARHMGYPRDVGCMRRIEHKKCLLLDVQINTWYAADYLAGQLRRYRYFDPIPGGPKRRAAILLARMRMAVSAYNAGSHIEGNRAYVNRVMAEYYKLSKLHK